MTVTAFEMLVQKIQKAGHLVPPKIQHEPLKVLAHMLSHSKESMPFFPMFMEHISLEDARDCMAENPKKPIAEYVDYLAEHASDAHLSSCFFKAISHRNIDLFQALRLKFPQHHSIKTCLMGNLDCILSACSVEGAPQWFALFLEYKLPIPSELPNIFVFRMVSSGDYRPIQSRITQSQLRALIDYFTASIHNGSRAIFFQRLYNDIQQKLFEQLQDQQAIDATLSYASNRLIFLLRPLCMSYPSRMEWFNLLLHIKSIPMWPLETAIKANKHEFVQQLLTKHPIETLESIFQHLPLAANASPQMLSVMLNELNLHLLNPMQALLLPPELRSLISEYLAIQSNMTDTLFAAIDTFNLNAIQVLADHYFIDYQQENTVGENILMAFVHSGGRNLFHGDFKIPLVNALFYKFSQKPFRLMQRNNAGLTVFQSFHFSWEEQCVTHLVTKLCAAQKVIYLTDIDPEELRCMLGLQQHVVANYNLLDCIFVDDNEPTLVCWKGEARDYIPLDKLPKEFPREIGGSKKHRAFMYEIYKILHTKNPIFLGPTLPPAQQIASIPPSKLNIAFIALLLACNPGTESLPFTVHLAGGETRVFPVSLLACAVLQDNNGWYDALVAKGFKHRPSDLELTILYKKNTQSLPYGFLSEYIKHMQEQNQEPGLFIRAMFAAAHAGNDLIVNQLINYYKTHALLPEICLLFSENIPTSLLDKLLQPGYFDEQLMAHVLVENRPVHSTVLRKIIKQYPRIEQVYVAQFIFQDPVLNNSAYWKKFRQQRDPDLGDLIEYLRGLQVKSNTLWTSYYSGQHSMPPLFLHTLENSPLEEAKLMLLVKIRETVRTLSLDTEVTASPATRMTPTVKDLQSNMAKLGLTIDWNEEVPVKKRTSIFSTVHISLEKHITDMRSTNPTKFKALCNASTQELFENALKKHKVTCCRGDTTSWKIYDQLRPRAAF